MLLVGAAAEVVAVVAVVVVLALFIKCLEGCSDGQHSLAPELGGFKLW